MRRRHRRITGSPDLDITAFMNLMIVLVPVLLLGMVFSQVRMIELNFPGTQAGDTLSPDEFKLVVTLIPQGIEIGDSERGVIKVLPVQDGQQNYPELQLVLRQIKARMPDKTDLILEVGPDIDYQTLVRTMDTVRSYPAVVAASVVEGELFPDVALMDAQEDRTLAATAGLATGEGA
ncbi:biopolymer transporter ExbD [Marinobacter salinisoli]|uniref:Biopolymer transporter ExbD n=1 Tax=Marinobacter salinisoli TaxID=2769486 RepID=A0ABX7MN86_9GAMM|nr:biopolymer transporter ExbD [Marinobacter salinisoli]QSP93715.1 biopolymer transporter ExbD [Marinobacter salinisoli]